MRSWREWAVVMMFAVGYVWLLGVEDRITFLHAWGVVKRIRVDRLEKKICEELATKKR